MRGIFTREWKKEARRKVSPSENGRRSLRYAHGLQNKVRKREGAFCSWRFGNNLLAMQLKDEKG
jgi:hypothetical protein